MEKKKDKIVYWIFTGLLTLLMLFSSGMYIFNHEMVKTFFVQLGYPTYLIYPLATAKLLGLIALWTRKSTTLKEWAYAGFFFDFVLAFAAHLHVEDGGHYTALVAVIVLLGSYIFEKKAFLGK